MRRLYRKDKRARKLENILDFENNNLEIKEAIRNVTIIAILK